MGEEILVIANGKWEKNTLFENLISKADFIIALDGAADRFDEWDVVVGDMDSIKEIGDNEVDKNQDNSDLSKALEKYPVCSVFGIEGGRLDHRIGAFVSLIETNSNAILYFDGWRACRVPKIGKEFNLKVGSKCALFSLGKSKSVTITGVEYQLEKQDLKTGTKGLGNKVTNSEVFVQKSEGDLLFIWEENGL